MAKISPEAADAIASAYSNRLIIKKFEEVINDYPVITSHLYQSELAESQKEQKELKRFEESYYGKVIRNEPE